MSLRSLLQHPVRVFNRAAGAVTPGFSDETITFDAGTDVLAFVDPLDAKEYDADRQTRLTEFTVFLPPTAAIAGTSEIEGLPGSPIDGRRLRVIGEPRPYARPRRGVHHLEVVARAVED